MIPEEIQRLLEGNHEFLLAPFLLYGGKSAVVAGEETEKLFAPRCVESERGAEGPTSSLKLMVLGSSGYVYLPCL